MNWQAVSRKRAREIVAEEMCCRLTGEGLRVSAVSECLRTVSHLCSVPEGGDRDWEPVTSLRLTGLVRHRLSPLWPDLSGDDQEGCPGVMQILNHLANLGDMVRLKGGKWLVAPAHAVSIGDGLAVLLGGGPTEVLPNALSARVSGRVRLVDQFACEDWIGLWEADEWIGAPAEGIESWSESLLARASAKLMDAPDNMADATAYIRRVWVRLEDLPLDQRGLLLCKASFSGVTGQMSSYFIGEFFRGRLRRLSGIKSSDARRLRFYLDAQMGCPVKIVAVASHGMVMLRIRRPLPDREAKVLLLGWQVPNPESKYPHATRHIFPLEILPVLRRVFEGLRIVFDVRF